jgi:WhiB family transcriptional regulator, redox-sensing transcriptional regulator
MRDIREWAHRAACRHEDPELFFSTVPDELVMALRICGGCTVRDDCYDYALANHHRIAGVWGGMTEDARTRALTRPQPATP